MIDPVDGCRRTDGDKDQPELVGRRTGMHQATDPGSIQPERVMLAHDYLLVMRGAERTFAAMADVFPEAPISTLLYDASVFDARLATHPIRTSPLQRLGVKQSHFKALLPLMPWAVRQLHTEGYNLVVSSSSAFAHRIAVDHDAVHVCYCHTPFRYAWYAGDSGLAQLSPALRRPTALLLSRIRASDRRAAQQGAYYIANSTITQKRMQDYWGVSAPVVHPPVDLDRFQVDDPEDYVLIVSELVRHKQIDVALEAAIRAGVRAKVVGGGSDEPRLRRQYSGKVDFLGRLDDQALAVAYAHARALVMPNIEEFGITAVEAQASGRPVVAVAAGGALETVLDGETGILVPPDNLNAIAEVLSDSALDRLTPAAAVRNAQRFSVGAFQANLRHHIELAKAGAGRFRCPDGPAAGSLADSG